jgi:hypothetical protein
MLPKISITAKAPFQRNNLSISICDIFNFCKVKRFVEISMIKTLLTLI